MLCSTTSVESGNAPSPISSATHLALDSSEVVQQPSARSVEGCSG
jgi:hypothetical protein